MIVIVLVDVQEAEVVMLMQYLLALASDPSLPCSLVVLCQVATLKTIPKP